MNCSNQDDKSKQSLMIESQVKMMCDRGNGWVKVSKDGAIQNEGQINFVFVLRWT